MGRRSESKRHTPFGSVLAAAIREEFRSQKEFCEGLGFGPTYLSNVLCGRERPTPENLKDILLRLRSIERRDRVRSAWVREFVPLPGIEDETYDDAEALEQVDALWHGQRLVRALDVAVALKARMRDENARHQMSERVVQIALELTKTGEALGEIEEMELSARDRNDRTDLLTALWMRSVATRNLDHPPLEAVRTVFSGAMDLAWSTASHKDPDLWVRRRMELQRDFGLQLVDLVERRQLSPEHLELALSRIRGAIESYDETGARALGIEARARAELAMGNPGKAEDSLEEAMGLEPLSLYAVPDKVLVMRGRIAWARGEIDLAVDLLGQVSARAFDKLNLHRHKMADQLLGRILLEDTISRKD